MNKVQKEGDSIFLLEVGREKELLKQLLSRLQQRDALSFEELASLYTTTKPELTIPLSIFRQKLHPAEALCKYLKEEECLTNQQIGIFLNRNEKSVWASYQRAIQKQKQPFSLPPQLYVLPFSLFSTSQCSILENVVWYLKQVYHLPIIEIAKQLGSTPNSVRVLLNRARNKHD